MNQPTVVFSSLLLAKQHHGCRFDRTRSQKKIACQNDLLKKAGKRINYPYLFHDDISDLIIYTYFVLF